MRVLVCGGRFFSDKDLMWKFLDSFHDEHPITTLMHGDAKGADRMSGEWAIEHGLVPLKFPADWDKFGLSAGPKRNAQMLVDGKPEYVIAFEGNSGTSDMIGKARMAGVPVYQVLPDSLDTI